MADGKRAVGRPGRGRVGRLALDLLQIRGTDSGPGVRSRGSQTPDFGGGTARSTSAGQTCCCKGNPDASAGRQNGAAPYGHALGRKPAPLRRCRASGAQDGAPCIAILFRGFLADIADGNRAESTSGFLGNPSPGSHRRGQRPGSAPGRRHRGVHGPGHRCGRRGSLPIGGVLSASLRFRQMKDGRGIFIAPNRLSHHGANRTK